MVITATEFKTNLGKYLSLLAEEGQDITITKNGKTIALVSRPKPSPVERLSSLKDEFGAGGPIGDTDDELRTAALEAKHATDL